jgi:hypothetical protein
VSLAVDPSIPADQAMLLRVIDAKFETSNAKLDGISSTLAAMNERFGLYDKRFDDHEHRLAEMEGHMKARELQVKDFEDTKATLKEYGKSIFVLEKWQTEEQTTSRNASSWGKAAWGVCGSGITALVGFLLLQFGQAKKETVHVPAPTVQVQDRHSERVVTQTGGPR